MSILATSNLRKYFGEVHAIDDVNMEIGEGNVVFIIGPNGSGKTTLINLISGVIQPDAGKIVFRGRDITHTPPDQRVKLGLARSFQIVSLFDDFSALDNVRIATICQLGRSARIFSSFEGDGEARHLAMEVLGLFGLADKKSVQARKLSQGDRKLLDVAMALALKPKVILCDEPSSGVSSEEKWKVMDIITSAVKETAVTAIIVEHDMDLVFKYSDSVIAMHEGKVLAEGKPEDVRDSSDVRTLILGV